MDWRRLAVLVVLSAGTAACSHGASPGASGVPSSPAEPRAASATASTMTVTTPPSHWSPAPPPHTLRATETDNGRTVALRPGQRLEVALASTYWQLQRLSSTVLRLDSGPFVRPRPSGCVPGAGCGTVIATYVAVAPGSAEVVATRTSCGEAMGCTGATGRYLLHVVVR